MNIAKTFCENTKEGELYLVYNGYKGVKRILNTNYFLCSVIGNKLRDVNVISIIMKKH